MLFSDIFVANIWDWVCFFCKQMQCLVNKKKKHQYHNKCYLLWVITIQIKFECHHLPVVRFQLALCYSVSHIRDLQNSYSCNTLFMVNGLQRNNEWIRLNAYTKNIQLGLSSLFMARAAAYRSPRVTFHCAPLMATP